MFERKCEAIIDVVEDDIGPALVSHGNSEIINLP